MSIWEILNLNLKQLVHVSKASYSTPYDNFYGSIKMSI